MWHPSSSKLVLTRSHGVSNVPRECTQAGKAPWDRGFPFVLFNWPKSQSQGQKNRFHLLMEVAAKSHYKEWVTEKRRLGAIFTIYHIHLTSGNVRNKHSYFKFPLFMLPHTKLHKLQPIFDLIGIKKRWVWWLLNYTLWLITSFHFIVVGLGEYHLTNLWPLFPPL